MKRLVVRFIRKDDGSYPIYIGSGVFFKQIRQEIQKRSPTKIAIITDSNLKRLYGRKIEQSLKGYRYTLLSFPSGEKNKNIFNVLTLFSKLMRFKLDRSSLMIAFGGGVAGDMTGFLSSIYMRGIPFIQVPTSLLAMVDSSIGGKTGIDTRLGKNLMGSFYQPKAVVIDTDFLKTLPRKEFQNGMAEIIKHAAIMDRGYFQRILKLKNGILSLDPLSVISIIESSCRIKKRVVQKDEKETGLRQILNFGHTAGHAIEKASDFTIPHGHAISLGMVIEGWIAVQKNILRPDDLGLLIHPLKIFGLLHSVRDFRGLKASSIWNASQTDKKNTGGLVRMVFINRIGSVHQAKNNYSFPVTEKEFMEGLKFLKDLTV